MPTKHARILVIEDDESMQLILRELLVHAGFRVELANSIKSAKKQLDLFVYDAALIDIHLGEESGLDLVPYIVREFPFTKILVNSAAGSAEIAVQAMDLGAVSFVTKSADPRKIVNELKLRLEQAHIARNNGTFDEVFKKIGLVGSSDVMRDLFENIEQLKDVDATILLSGESGTGKELVARAIHSLSGRANQRFEAINCGAIPETLLESELFGYKKGAFTDAKTDKKGIFEICSEGTLFLDEIGELPYPLQVKLLRVLQEKEVKPIGSNQTIKINTKVVAATNKILADEVKKHKFREDLYFRLSVFPIELPPLRNRTDDIPELVEHFVKRFNLRYTRTVAVPSKDLLARLISYAWPGNIRELQNSLERAVVLSKDGKLHLEHILPKPTTHEPEPTESYSNNECILFTEAKNNFERHYVNNILQHTHGNVTEAAKIAGRYRSDIYRLMEKHHIKQEDFRSL